MDPYNAQKFWVDLGNDIWMLKIIGELPDNPPTQISSTYDEETGITAHSVVFKVDLCMDARRDAIQVYRKQLAPIVFTLAQKVYAELFRLVLTENNTKAGDTQYKVEEKLNDLQRLGSPPLVVSPIFEDKEEFDDWWVGRYRYDAFRLARNLITHQYYAFDGNRLIVKGKEDKEKSEQEKLLLDWTAEEVFDFARAVLAKANHVSMMWRQEE